MSRDGAGMMTAMTVSSGGDGRQIASKERVRRGGGEGRVHRRGRQ